WMKNADGVPQLTSPAAKPTSESPARSKVEEAFRQSTEQRPVTTVGERQFELGSFGQNAALRKQETRPDRFSSDELAATLDHVKTAYRSSDNASSYRKDNVAWVSEMP